jgi:hypothetical protein
VKCYIRENSFLALLAARRLKKGKMAMVLGRTILLHNTTAAELINNKQWLRHELAHVRQFQQQGYLPFLFKYLAESIRNGYYNNKYEREAREAEEDVSLEKNMTFHCAG